MRILICDDDAAFAASCKARLIALAKKHDVEMSVQISESGNQLLFFANTKYKRVDLIYLDHHMPGLSGMETARELRKRDVPADIVFYTVDEAQVYDAFDVEALHYMVKGRTDEEKFERIFLKAAARARKRHTEILSLSCAGEHRNIPVEDIYFFEVQKRIVTVHYSGPSETETFEFYSPLSKIQEFLYGRGFLRIHSAYLVAEKYIHIKNTQRVEMITGEILPVGKSYRTGVN